MNIQTILRVMVVAALVFLAGPPQRAKAQSQQNSNAVTAEKMKPDVKSTKRHQSRQQHVRPRKRVHHLDPGW
jgi:hypothetical protein